MSAGILFVQKRTHRAGAQSCLARLLAQPQIAELQPILVASQAGWLTEECERLGIPVVIEPFPSSRSMASRLFGNRSWAARVGAQLRTRGLGVGVVHANDHLEGLLSLELAQQLKARSLMLMRSPMMRRDDYFKYRCADHSRVLCVGEELTASARQWDPDTTIDWVPDGIDPDEFMEPKNKPPSFPDRVLVLGSPLDWKGWADLTGALYRLGERGQLPDARFEFTGDKPDPARNDLQLDRLPIDTCRFIGHKKNFRDVVRTYDLVINASWHETFGMAAVEVLAAGVPLVSSQTGVMGHLQTNDRFMYPPRDVNRLTELLTGLITDWLSCDPDLAGCQQRIRDRFLIGHSVKGMSSAYRGLLS
jgi:glycosyltransferase involved in cell wall biosynthesis